MLDFTQYYLDCLSHASYLIGDTTTGRAVVVDPQRDVSEYVADAAAKGLTIERVLETHFHADFLSGHLELAEATGATISYGEAARGKVEFDVELLADGQRLTLGEVELVIFSTPGHTPESISIVVYEHAGAEIPYGVLTGDTLFIGDVGRPDLLSSVGITADDLARQLYHSLHAKLLTLPDDTKVFPAHGAGSACGKNLSTETVSTIGEQRRSNYALAPMSEDEFVEAVTQGQSVAPLYFSFAATRNRQARSVFDEDVDVPMLDFDHAVEAQRNGAVVLDTRDSITFAAGHLAGSINVGIDGRYADYAGQVVRPGTPIVLVTEPGQEAEGRLRLGRIGFDDVIGALRDPVRTLVEHPEATVRSSRLTAAEMAERLRTLDDVTVIDVRNAGETEAGMVPGARNIPLARLLDEADSLDRATPTIVYCAGGYRSSVGASTLRWLGFTDVSDLLGGFGAWSLAGEAVEMPTVAS